jgi:hypothetical protein
MEHDGQQGYGQTVLSLQEQLADKEMKQMKQMQRNKSISGALLIATTLLFMLAACAKPYHFYVKYDLPESSLGLQGQKVVLKVLDGRESTDFLTQKAAGEFGLWDGKFAMYHTPKKPQGDTETYSLSGLIEAAMKKRLESLGIDVAEGETDDVPLFELTLNKFQLDLKNRTWVSDFSYEVKLSKDTRKTGREKVSGQAERTKVMGRGAGELLVGDILTESINRLNIEKLFKNAGMD